MAVVVGSPPPTRQSLRPKPCKKIFAKLPFGRNDDQNGGGGGGGDLFSGVGAVVEQST